ncbi:hypothetical protein [Brachymonas denitrificans]|jgi:hypothetical protein|uniref:Uncharacterized protein n=1 Tax=Brachymonas denitrificans DSM 15123 TaxID=1121117 RepID=A0A1H8HDT4_9BURK|nr:hypothetical protein [Brachymonas denitrificans]SEN54363.1 hypothetical protein SAMN02745977_01523 [Brachymonas denitrificans DSM 15123]
MKTDKEGIVIQRATAMKGGKRAWGKWLAVPALLAAGLASPAVWAQCPTPDVGKQFPGPPVQDDLRQTLNTPQDCMTTIQPKRMSPRELQELRKAIREHARANGRKLRSR